MKNASPDEGLAPEAKSEGVNNPACSTPAAAPSTHHRKTDRTRASQSPAPLSQTQAWDWIKAEAGATGRMTASVNNLAKQFRWPRARVEWLLSSLRSEAMIKTRFKPDAEMVLTTARARRLSSGE